MIYRNKNKNYEKAFNDFLQEIVKESITCKKCKFNHNDTCFFAYGCCEKYKGLKER